LKNFSCDWIFLVAAIPSHTLAPAFPSSWAH
jgi:hypothetical protein